jgi:predicted nucleic acid-binding protein
MIWVVNASPMILLAKIGQADLLLELSSKLVVPQAVADEVLAGSMDDPSRDWLQSKAAGSVQPNVTSTDAVVAWDLGAGETAVISWAAQNPGCEAILDDRAARRCAEVMRVQVTGTLGVLLLAKKRGLLRHARPWIEQLMKVGAHLDGKLVDHALRLVGE